MEQVIHCTEDMMKQTVWDAMHTELSNVEDVKVNNPVFSYSNPVRFVTESPLELNN